MMAGPPDQADSLDLSDVDVGLSLDLVEAEAMKGLPADEERMGSAAANLDFYELRNAAHIELRPAETDEDFSARPKRTSRITRCVVDKLCEHLYGSPPTRKLADAPAAADRWLQDAYKKARFDAVMAAADRHATLNDCCAVQVIATGNPAKPVRYRPWDASLFAAYFPDDDPLEPWAVCTKAVFPDRRRIRYQLWSALEYRTYWTRKGDLTGLPSDGRIADFSPSESGTHPYGRLPFFFVHNQIPTSEFWSGGIGTTLREGNAELDRELSDLGQAIERYSAPQGFTRNVGPQFRMLARPGGFVELANRGNDPDTPVPEVFYLQADLQIEAVWSDIKAIVDQMLGDLGVPLVAVRVEQGGDLSGISVVAQQLPLLSRTKRRQRDFSDHEDEAARTTLAVAGGHYRQPVLTAAATSGRLEATWPEPQFPLPTPERDAGDAWELDRKFKSRVEVIAERRGLTRQQALEVLKQIEKDEEDVEAILGPAPAPAPPPMPGGKPGQKSPAAENEPDPADEGGDA